MLLAVRKLLLQIGFEPIFRSYNKICENLPFKTEADDCGRIRTCAGEAQSVSSRSP